MWRLNPSFNNVDVVDANCNFSKSTFVWCITGNMYVITGMKTAWWAVYVSSLVNALVRSLSKYFCFLVSRLFSAVLVCKEGAVFAPKISCTVEQSSCVILCCGLSVPDVRSIVGRLCVGMRVDFLSSLNYQSIM